MRSGSFSGISLDDEFGVSSSLPIAIEAGGAYWLDEDEPRHAYGEGPAPKALWQMSESERQEHLRAEAARRADLVQDVGVYDDLVGRPTVHPEDERYLVDGVFDTHANEVSDITLQREIRIPGGGGGSRSGRTRQKVLKKSVHEPAGRAVHGDRLVHTVVFRHLTRGQQAVARDHPDVPTAIEAMLCTVSREVAGGMAPPRSEKRKLGNKTLVLIISDREVASHFRSPYMRGSAVAVLIEVVMRFDSARVQRLDASHRREMAEAAA